MVQHDPDYSDSKELINSVLHSFSILTLSLALLPILHHFFANIYLQNEQEKSDAMPSTKSEGKKKKAAQLKKKKKRKKTKKAENEDKPEQQPQTSVDDGIVRDNQGTHLFMCVT